MFGPRAGPELLVEVGRFRMKHQLGPTIPVLTATQRLWTLLGVTGPVVLSLALSGAKGWRMLAGPPGNVVGAGGQRRCRSRDHSRGRRPRRERACRSGAQSSFRSRLECRRLAAFALLQRRGKETRTATGLDMPKVMPKRLRKGAFRCPGCNEAKKTAPETLNFQGGRRG